MAKKARKSAAKKSSRSAGKRGSARKKSMGGARKGSMKKRGSAKRSTAKRPAKRAARRSTTQSRVNRVKRVTREVVHQAGVAMSAGVESLKDIGGNLVDRVRATTSS